MKFFKRKSISPPAELQALFSDTKQYSFFLVSFLFFFWFFISYRKYQKTCSFLQISENLSNIMYSCHIVFHLEKNGEIEIVFKLNIFSMIFFILIFFLSLFLEERYKINIINEFFFQIFFNFLTLTHQNYKKNTIKINSLVFQVKHF